MSKDKFLNYDEAIDLFNNGDLSEDSDYEYYDVEYDYDAEGNLIVTKYDTPAIRFQKYAKDKIEDKLRKLESKFSKKLYNEIIDDAEDYLNTYRNMSYECWSNLNGLTDEAREEAYEVECEIIENIYEGFMERLDRISRLTRIS